MTFDKAKEEEKRKKMNEDILKRLKAGENLQDSAAKTWYPPRPIIQKDPDKIKKLYGEDAKIIGQTLKAVPDEEEGDSNGRKD